MHVYISALYLSSCPEINDMLFLCLKQMEKVFCMHSLDSLCTCELVEEEHMCTRVCVLNRDAFK